MYRPSANLNSMSGCQCKPAAQRKRDSAQPKAPERKRDGAQPKAAQPGKAAKRAHRVAQPRIAQPKKPAATRAAQKR